MKEKVVHEKEFLDYMAKVLIDAKNYDSKISSSHFTSPFDLLENLKNGHRDIPIKIENSSGQQIAFPKAISAFMFWMHEEMKKHHDKTKAL